MMGDKDRDKVEIIALYPRLISYGESQRVPLHDCETV
jgi:hypothetical protein